MKVEQIYTGCLAHGAYYIESNGEVAIIDPLRDVNPYVEMAEKDNAKIKYVFETHFHADFVSGHITLAEKTGAQIVYGPKANPTYDVKIANESEIFNVGDVQIKAIHTPGHSMESTSYLLIDENGKEHAIFSGDTLFIGDVGRPDLANGRVNMTKEELAEYLYDSLHNKIMPLADDIIVYPGHGAGSACGKNISSKTIDTLGNQKNSNYALQPMSKEEFVKEVTDGLLPPPEYFPHNVKMNMHGYENLDAVIKTSKKPLSVDEFSVLAKDKNNLILDVRHQSEFIKGFVPNSIFIGLNGSFAPWVGAVIKDVKQPILLVTEKGDEEKAITHLSRVGFDNVLGYLNGGFETWKTSSKEIDTLQSVSADFIENKIQNENDAIVFDARKPGEYASEHIEGVANTPLDYLNDHIAEFPKEEQFYVHCASGYRSVIASSILKSRGFHNVNDVAGGFKALSKTSLKRTAKVCPSTLK